MKVYVRSERVPACTSHNVIDVNTGKPPAGGINVWFADPVSDRWLLFEYSESDGIPSGLELELIRKSELYTRKVEGGGSPFLECGDSAFDCRYRDAFKIKNMDGIEFHRLYGILFNRQEQLRRYSIGQGKHPPSTISYFKREGFPDFQRLIDEEIATTEKFR